MAVDLAGRLVLREFAGSFCWAIGYEQRRIKDHVLHGLPEVFEINVHEQGGDVSNVWLHASPRFDHLLQRFLVRLARAGDPVRACVLWMPDLKDTSVAGFILTQGSIKDHVLPKMMLQLEAELVAIFSEKERPAEIVISSDLDVIVFPGWVHALQRCVTGSGAADVCFTQRPAGFDDEVGAEPSQLVNSGVSAARAGNGANAARLLAEVGRHQSQDAFDVNTPSKEVHYLETGQIVLNHVLDDVRQAVAESRVTRPLLWGIYNPLLVHSGFLLQPTVLSTRLQHVTGSEATTKMKLRFMDAAELLRHDLEVFCPPYSARERTAFVGPLNAFCLQMMAWDPHFGRLLPPFKIHEGYNSSEYDSLKDHLADYNVEGYSVDLILRFGGSFRHYRQARRNSTHHLCAHISRSCQASQTAGGKSAGSMAVRLPRL